MKAAENPGHSGLPKPLAEAPGASFTSFRPLPKVNDRVPRVSPTPLLRLPNLTSAESLR
jgi:hypothetical protein